MIILRLPKKKALVDSIMVKYRRNLRRGLLLGDIAHSNSATYLMVPDEALSAAFLYSVYFKAKEKGLKVEAMYATSIDLDKVLPLYGEYCIYLYSRIFSPEEQDADLVIGASGDIKIWFNEELKGSYSGSYIWNPVMYFIPVHLKKGVNNIVIKYVKKCSKSVLSVDFHKPNKEKIPGRSIWLTNLGTVIG